MLLDVDYQSAEGILIWLEAGSHTTARVQFETGEGAGYSSISAFDAGWVRMGGADQYMADSSWKAEISTSSGLQYDMTIRENPSTSPLLTLDLGDSCDEGCHLLMWTGGSVELSRFWITSDDPGASASLLKSSLSTHFSDGQDMVEEDYVHLMAGGTATTYQSEGTYEFSVAGRGIGLVGMFFAPTLYSNVTIEGPSGSMACPCYFLAEPLEPGNYVIRRDALGFETLPGYLIGLVDVI